MDILNFNELGSIIPEIRVVINRTGFDGWHVRKRTILDQELVLILGGNGFFTIENKEYPVRPGMLFYFYPELEHSGRTLLIPPMRFLAVHFSLFISRHTEDKFQIDDKQYLLPIEPVNILVNHYAISRIFHELQTTWLEKKLNYQWKQNILFERLLYEIQKDIGITKERPADVKRIDTVLQFIQNNYASSIALNQLCSLIGLQAAHFSYLFKKVTGKTAIAYLNQVRIDKSKDLLLNSSKKIKEIACLTGFNDEFYYSRIFTAIEGCSPKEYRKQFIN